MLRSKFLEGKYIMQIERQPIEVRYGDVPTVQDWNQVSEVQVWGPVDDNGKKLCREAHTNSVHRPPLRHMDQAAKDYLDPEEE